MYLFIFKYWGKKTFTWLCHKFRWMDWMLDWYPHQVILFVWLCDNFMNVWILQIREIPFILFKTLYISLFAARCFVFNQTTFKRHIVPTGDPSSASPPMFDNSPLTWADCFQECHYAPGCQSVVIEGENCRLYTDTGNHGNDSFNAVSSLSYSNLNGKIESCLVWMTH